MTNHATHIQYPGFDDRLLRLVGVPLVALIIPYIFFQLKEFDLRMFIVGILYTVVIWEGSRVIIIQGTKRFPAASQLSRRLLWAGGLAVLYVALACFVITEVLEFIRPGDYEGLIPPKEASYWASYVTLLAIGAMYESAYFFALWKRALTEKEQLEQAHLASQLEGLRNQVNPHFLFNSLNTLLYLIPEDPDKASRFVRHMSKVYRYILESRDDKVIPLREELTFLEAYIFLLKERFGESLRVSIADMAGQDNSAIVPLTLQMLFENAIKHNIISVGKPLTITLSLEGDHIIVRNNFQPKRQAMDSTGVGLNNIRRRYEILANREVGVIASPLYFTVTVPIIPLSSVQ